MIVPLVYNDMGIRCGLKGYRKEISTISHLVKMDVKFS